LPAATSSALTNISGTWRPKYTIRPFARDLVPDVTTVQPSEGSARAARGPFYLEHAVEVLGLRALQLAIPEVCI